MKNFSSFVILLILAFLGAVNKTFANTTPWDFTVDNIHYKITDSGEVSVTYNYYHPSNGYDDSYYSCDYSGDITIPQTVTYNGNNYTVTAIDEYAFYSDEKESLVTSVTIPKTVTKINNCAFCGCSKITNLILPDGLISIGNSTFSGCTGLTSLDLPNSVSEIGSSAFYRCI